MINVPVSGDTNALYTFLALGDSYTIGEAVDSNEKFPDQTVKLLAGEGIGFRPPDIIATTGWTTSNLIDTLNTQRPKNNYTVVSLLIGVNNQYQHKSIDQYNTEFTELLNRAIIYANNRINHVFVLSIPDYSVTPFASDMDTIMIAREIDEFNGANKEISLMAGVHYIDITSISREAKNDPALFASDRLHPSAYQYSLWSKLLADSIKKVLK